MWSMGHPHDQDIQALMNMFPGLSRDLLVPNVASHHLVGKGLPNVAF